MVTRAPHIQHTFERRVFQGWSIALPVGMEETFIADDGYWHAWSDDRSISLSSIVITDRRGAPVAALDILERATPIDGKVVALSDDLPGWARSIRLPKGSRANRAISGMLAVDGNVLLITVTSDDDDWSLWVWRSIKHHRHAVRRRYH